MRDTERILVTAALPYANGPIHLGHIAGAYLPADLYVRFQRLRRKDILFICGSDEHGVPITLTAEKEGITPQQVVDRYHAMNGAAFGRLGISFDNYSRTSLPLHHQVAQEFFSAFHARGILREKQEQQFYDEQAGMFLPDRYVEGTCPVCANPDARGDQCEKCGSYLNPTELDQSEKQDQRPAPCGPAHDPLVFSPRGLPDEARGVRAGARCVRRLEGERPAVLPGMVQGGPAGQGRHARPGLGRAGAPCGL